MKKFLKESVIVYTAFLLLIFGLVWDFATHESKAYAQQALIPVKTLAAFTPTGQATIAATTSSSNVALPTNGSSSPTATTVIVTNESSTAVMYVLLGTSNTVSVTTTTGYPIVPNGIAVLTIRNNTYIAAIGSATGSVGISTGY